MLNPFESSTTSWNSTVDILNGGDGFQRQYIQFPSPDFTRTVLNTTLYDIATGEALTSLQAPDEAVIVWLPDSSTFAAEVTVDENHSEIALFDRNGEFIETVFNLDSARINTPENMHWTSSGQYLAFRPTQATLMIGDIETNKVIDTCLSTGSSFVWSPDGTQIAFLEPGNGTQNVYVFDLASWSLRAVARHIVQTNYWDKVIGWRADD